VSVAATPIEGVYVVRGGWIPDERGSFRQHYNARAVAGVAGEITFAQGNHSRSQPGVLRGFHLEPWDKFIHVPRGTALVVVADTRPDSPTFARTFQILLGDEPGEHSRVLIRRGLANAFFALTEVDYLNDVSAEYHEEGREGIAWDDPDLGIDWPTRTPILSAADSSWPTLRERFPDAPWRSVPAQGRPSPR
jgi:dTDP-4-dehydrorhamnose 3,5-epimerase